MPVSRLADATGGGSASGHAGGESCCWARCVAPRCGGQWPAPINQWGASPFPLPRLTAHSQSRGARDLLAGDLGAHRQLPVPADDPTGQPQASPETVDAAGGYDRAAWQRAWSKRRADLDRLAGVADVLTDIDQRVSDLQGRVTALLNSEI